MKLTPAEWSVMEVLWSGDRFHLKELTEALQPVQDWSKNTVHTYLTRMAAKGLIHIDRSVKRPYSAAVRREDWAREERQNLLCRVYKGDAGEMLAAFLKEADLTRAAAEQLRRLLDEMEV